MKNQELSLGSGALLNHKQGNSGTFSGRRKAEFKASPALSGHAMRMHQAVHWAHLAYRVDKRQRSPYPSPILAGFKPPYPCVPATKRFTDQEHVVRCLGADQAE